MKTTERYFSIHRHSDNVAFNFADTPTLYLSPDMAQAVAELLLRYAADCRETAFTQSTLPTSTIDNR